MKTLMIMVLILLCNYPILTIGDHMASMTDYVIAHEGFKDHQYLDNTQYSIGHGLDVKWCKKNGWKGSMRNGRLIPGYMNKADAKSLLSRRLQEDRKAILRLIPSFNTAVWAVQAAIHSAFYNAQTYVGPNVRHFFARQEWKDLSFELAYDHTPDKSSGNSPKVQMALVHRRISEANAIRQRYGYPLLMPPRNMAAFKKLRLGWRNNKKKRKVGAAYAK